jgi:hypothetical protein
VPIGIRAPDRSTFNIAIEEEAAQPAVAANASAAADAPKSSLFFIMFSRCSKRATGRP